MRKKVSEAQIAGYERDGAAEWRGQWLLLVLIGCLVVAGCSAPGYHPPPQDPQAPVHREPGGSNGSNGTM